MQHENTSLDLLADEATLVSASSGKRLLNYLIDIVAFYAVIFLVALLMVLVAPDLIEGLLLGLTDNTLGEQLFALVLYAAFMGSLEALLKGKSVGKLITKTRAVNLDGSTISTKTAFLRAFSRAVPFCVFSAFGSPCHPWQDRWTDTLVIDEKASAI
jgi:uncharacterized RDD family membrane protein YckC